MGLLCAANTHKVVCMRRERIGMKVGKVEWNGRGTKERHKEGEVWSGEGDPTYMLYFYLFCFFISVFFFSSS